MSGELKYMKVVDGNSMRYVPVPKSLNLLRVKDDLKYVKIKVEVPIDKGSFTKRKAIIKDVYPHCVIAEYKAGDDYTFKTGICIADLVNEGIISYWSGYPVVNPDVKRELPPKEEKKDAVRRD